MSDEAGEKKHDASEKKWRDAAEKGQIPRSQDVSAVAVLLTAGAVLVYGMGPARDAIAGVLVKSFTAGTEPFTMAVAEGALNEMLYAVARCLALPLGAVAVVALIVNLLQTRFQIATKALEPNWDRLNVVTGLKNQYLSWTPLVELGKGVGKIGALALVVVMALKDRLEELPALAALTPAQLLIETADFAWSMLLFSAPLLMVIAAADYAYATYKMSQDLRRTDKEVRDESKEQDGDPHFRAARRSRQREIAMGSMLAAIAEADVVITNPTHYAVALRYNRADPAPTVVARGVDHLALRLRAEARVKGVPIVENRPLARALHAQTKVGQAIPEGLFRPVAKILAVVFRRRKRRRSTKRR